MLGRVVRIVWCLGAFGFGAATACGGSSTTVGGSSGQGGSAGAGAATGKGGTSTGAGASGGASAAGGSDGSGATGATGATGSGASTGSGAVGGSGATGSGATGSGATGSGATGSGATGSGATGSGAFAGTCGPGGCFPGTDAGPIDPPGPVLCGGVECGPSEACCVETHECFDPLENPEACAQPPPDDDLYGRAPCASNAHCAANEYCALENGLCQGPGHCHPIGNCGECGGDTCRVCGCDGNTYPNIQTACLARTNVVVAATGGCGETVMVGAGGSGGTVRTITACGTNENCPAGELCCNVTGHCYPETDPDRCRVPPEGTNFPCTGNDQCWDFEYCAGEGCEGPGGCVNKGSYEQNCGVTLEPVCGCDGTTYTSLDCALSRGVRFAHDGECEGGK